MFYSCHEKKRKVEDNEIQMPGGIAIRDFGGRAYKCIRMLSQTKLK